MEKMKLWEAEVNALELESASNPTTLKDQLAALLFTADVPFDWKKQQAVWDPNGDGNMTLGDFRMHIRGLGIRSKMADNAHCDALFKEWDDDANGSIDMFELETVLKKLYTEWLATEGKAGAARMRKQQQLDFLKKRIQAAQDALAAHEAAEQASNELQQMTATIAGRVDIQLGGLLSRRGFKAGELVGSWQGPRPLPRPPGADSRPRHAGQRVGQRTGLFSSEHRGELTKREFAKGVLDLGLMVGEAQEPPTVASLGQLFDDVDADHSGFLDLREAAKALKEWEAEGKRMYAEKAAKAKQLSTLRTQAGRKLQSALRDMGPASPNKSPGEGKGLLSARQGGWRERLALLSSRQSAEKAERKRELAERARERAKLALHFMANQSLSRGWTTWRQFCEERAHAQALMVRPLRDCMWGTCIGFT